MSRSGYTEDCDDVLAMGRWRAAVKSAIRGKRGQAFLKEMLAAMDALPEHKLIAEELEMGGAVCAIGSVGKARGVDMSKIDAHDAPSVAAAFGISHALAAEIEHVNDDYTRETPEARFARVRKWIDAQIVREQPSTT